MIVAESFKYPVLGLVVGLLVACGGSGGSANNETDIDSSGDDESSVIDNETDPPVTSIIFPGADALITGSDITLRGTVSDASAISSVSVNGVEAVVDSSQQPALWQLSLNLAPGQHQLRIRTEDEFGNSNEAASTLAIKAVNTLIPAAIDVAVGPDGNLFLLDRSFQLRPTKIVKMDPLSGLRTVISESADGNPIPLPDPTAIAVGGDGAIFVVDRLLDAVVQVDPFTGVRTVLSGADPASPGNSIGAGPPFLDLTGIAVFNNNQDLLVTDRVLNAIIRISRANGDRVIVSQSGDAQPVSLDNPADIAISNDDSEYYATSERRVIQIAPDGSRSILIENSIDEAFFVELNDIAFGADGSLFVGDRAGYLFNIDPATGSGSIVDQIQPDETIVFSPVAVATEQDGRVIVIPNFTDVVFRVDPLNGERSLISDATIGSGQSFFNLRDVTVDSDGSIVVMDSNASRVVRVDPQSGDRTRIAQTRGGRAVAIADGEIYALTSSALFRVDPVSITPILISSASMGTGDTFTSPIKLAVDAAGKPLVVDRAVNLTDYAAIVRVDPVSGNRTLLSGRTASTAIRGSGDAFLLPTEITRLSNSKMLISDNIDANSHVLVEVDTVTGDRNTLGQSFASINGISIDANGRVVVIDTASDILYSVDIDTGNRTILSSDSVGSGVEFGGITGLVVEVSGVVVMVDSQNTALIRVDPVTGDRAIISY